MCDRCVQAPTLSITIVVMTSDVTQQAFSGAGCGTPYHDIMTSVRALSPSTKCSENNKEKPCTIYCKALRYTRMQTTDLENRTELGRHLALFNLGCKYFKDNDKKHEVYKSTTFTYRSLGRLYLVIIASRFKIILSSNFAVNLFHCHYGSIPLVPSVFSREQTYSETSM